MLKKTLNRFNNYLGICDWHFKVDNSCNPLDTVRTLLLPTIEMKMNAKNVHFQHCLNNNGFFCSMRTTTSPATRRPATRRPATRRPATLLPATLRPATLLRPTLNIKHFLVLALRSLCKFVIHLFRIGRLFRTIRKSVTERHLRVRSLHESTSLPAPSATFLYTRLSLTTVYR